jgi:hypothetical protein
MIRILSYIIFSISWFFVFKQLKRNKYKGLFEGLNVQLLTSPFTTIIKFINELVFNKLTEKSVLNLIAVPLGLDWKSLSYSN